jgi:aspartate carbamoyltransferase catalytic subunit
MSKEHFLSPVAITATPQHVVADPKYAERLYEVLPENPDVLCDLENKHIVSIKDFSDEEIVELCRLAAGYECGKLAPKALPHGAIMSDLFLDYTRPQIRLSFNRAWIRMGGSVMNIERTIQEMMANRDEAYQEVAELCSTISDISVVLTQRDGVLEEMLKYSHIPIINAGNGSGEHPSHALADLYTLFKWKPDLVTETPKAPLQIAVYGDPSYTRTIRSFLFGLTKFPQAVERVVVMDHVRQPFQPGQRQELENGGLTVVLASELYPRETAFGAGKFILPETDVVYVHELVSKEVLRMRLVESKELLRPETMILNPEIQIQEYANLINNSSNNGYFAQARGSTFIRTALLSAVMGLCKK